MKCSQCIIYLLSSVSVFCETADIRRVLFLKIPEARKQLLMSEVDRVAQVQFYFLYLYFMSSGDS